MNDHQNGAVSAWAGWPLEREIVISRVIDAPKSLVFAAWSNADEIQEWFGPAGFAIETREIDVRQGGRWRFDMVAPDGTRYGNRMIFLRLQEPDLIEVQHGEDKDEDPGRFRMLVTFDEQSNGKTVLTLRQLHPSREIRAERLGFGAVEYGGQTLEKLARHVEARAGR